MTTKRKRLIALILLISMGLTGLLGFISYAFGAGSYSKLGTNETLGSPILNSSFSINDWNKWEMVCWGVFLSNFATPFIDDYNSAFNLDASYGSKGAGAKALQFGSGQDVANSKVLQDLLNYALTQQTSGAIKPVYVSYNILDNFKIDRKSAFASQTQSSTTQSNTAQQTTNTQNQTTTTGPATIREATVKDLLFIIDSNGRDVKNYINPPYNRDDLAGVFYSTSNTVYNLAGFRSAVGKNLTSSETYMPNIMDPGKWWSPFNTFIGELEGKYPIIHSAIFGSIPTFAIKTSSGNYRTVLDYSDSYDLSLIPLIVSRGATGEHKEEFLDLLNKIFSDPYNYKLVLDCFGNICTKIDGTYRVILPASSNQHLTIDPSINLVNSMVFNSCMKSSSSEDLLIHGGQTYLNMTQTLENKVRGGLPAFSNKSQALNDGQAVLYFDTDTIIVQDILNGVYQLDEKGTVGDFDLGGTIKKLYDADLNNLHGLKYQFKIEPANLQKDWFDKIDNKYKQAKDALIKMVNTSTQLANQFNNIKSSTVLTKIKTSLRDDLNIFGEPIVIPVQVDDGLDKKNQLSSEAGLRLFANYLYSISRQSKDTPYGEVTPSQVQEILNKSKTAEELMTNFLIDSDGSLTAIFKSFIASRSDLYTITDKNKLDGYTPDKDSNGTIEFKTYKQLFEGAISDAGYKLKPNVIANKGNWWNNVTNVLTGDKWNGTEAAKHNVFGRLVKAYTTSDVMTSIANVLGVREGTEFGVYSTYIYLTYLDWYGIINPSKALSTDANTSNFDPVIFDANSDILKVDLTKITEVLSDEEKEKQIMNWTYLMLSPTGGREYRSKLIISGLSDWIYDNYKRIVYGNASSYDTGVSGVVTKNSAGFLSVEPYSENFVTAWFVNNFSYFASFIIGGLLIFIIISGILGKKKISWFIISLLVVVNMVLVLPATGEIVPLIANNAVQKIFEEKMSYWAISESVTNASLEKDYVTGNTISTNYLGSLSQDEQAQVVNMVKELNTLYLDRALNIKQDISKKVTSTDSSTFEDVQQLRSARWMLPMIMRQFSATDGSANYVYLPLADKYDDLSNLYWYFKPDDAKYVDTINAKQGVIDTTITPTKYNQNNTDDLHTPSKRKEYFQFYTDLSSMHTGANKYYHISYEVNPSVNVHTYSYILPDKDLLKNTALPSPSNSDSYDDWAEKLAVHIKNFEDKNRFKTMAQNIEGKADKYNRFYRDTLYDVYGFLWATENPFHYFYQGVKDSFLSDGSLGKLVGDLQGTYATNVNGLEVRKSFMHDSETGNIRDILDLEEMFTNMIPYLYTMQIAAEGYGKEKGLFDDDEYISGIDAYKGNKKSWLFRSNWVTKLMENKDYHAPAIIRLYDGSKVKVANMMLPMAYEEAGRRMVFSEAQMYHDGLDESCLSLIELKCVQLNKEVSKKWTLLLNYANISGMTKEVLMRQMALDALLEFNSEFTPAGLFNAAYTMYPVGLDLRSISFDSVMKMLMLNVTHDTSYIYGDTMKTLVEDSDIGTSLLLLTTAAICSFLIPLCRNIALGGIFLLGFVMVVWSIFKSSKTKVKLSIGYTTCNLIFLAMTLIYFQGFRAIMAMTSTDEVLSLSQIEINTGNPVWCLIVVLLLNAVYVVGMYSLLVFCFKHCYDMGYEVFSGIAELAVSKVSNSLDKLGAKAAGGDVIDSSGSRGASRANSRRHSKSNSDSDSSESVSSTNSSNNSSTNSSNNSYTSSSNARELDYDMPYKDPSEISSDSSGAADIDSRIDRGKITVDRQVNTSKNSSNSSDDLDNWRKQSERMDSYIDDLTKRRKDAILGGRRDEIAKYDKDIADCLSRKAQADARIQQLKGSK